MPRKFYNGIDSANQRVLNVADPTSATDAANKQYVDALLQGLSWKAPVRVASTANLTISAPGATINGVTMVINDRFLAKDQTTTSQNGIYIWNGAAVAATRALDANSTAELRNATVYVSEGTVGADTAYVQTAEVTTVDTTAQTWVQTGGGTTYSAGNGLQLTSTTFSVLADPVAGGGIVVSAAGVRVDTAVVVRKFAANIGNGSLTSIAVTHNLGTTDITYSLKEVSTSAIVEADVVVTDGNNVTFTFATAPTTNQFRVVIHA